MPTRTPRTRLPGTKQLGHRFVFLQKNHLDLLSKRPAHSIFAPGNMDIEEGGTPSRKPVLLCTLTIGLPRHWGVSWALPLILTLIRFARNGVSRALPLHHIVAPVAAGLAPGHHNGWAWRPPFPQ